MSSTNSKRAIAVDEINARNILNYLKKDKRHIKKFKYITQIILQNLKNHELYDKEEINSRCQNVYAIKFFKGQENDRIYCVEQVEGDCTFTIMCELMERKKNQRNKEREKNIINRVAGYEYEIITTTD